MDKKDIAVLRVIDGLWETYEWVPLSEIAKRVRLNKLKIKAKIKDLERQRLVSWRPDAFRGEPGIKLNEKGADTLAVWDFKNHGVIDDVGHVIGEGKEAVIVLGLKGGEKVAIKFHRYYSAEFRRIKNSLSYSVINWWRKRANRPLRPIDFPRAKAQVEYLALRKLHNHIPVPEPLGINRHAIVMQFIGDRVPAPLLYKVGGDREEIMDIYDKALGKGVVHGDFSPFNIMMWNRPYVIDWPQAVPADFKGAAELIKRDKKNMERFFTSA